MRATLNEMCEQCDGEPYRGVRALFNADFQALNAFDDRRDWLIVSKRLIVHIGDSALRNADDPLIRACEGAIAGLTDDERRELSQVSQEDGRTIFE